MVRLLFFIACFVTAIVIAFIGIKAGRNSAYEITAKHDLLHFVEAEQAYYAENGYHSGEVGHVMSNDPSIPSTFYLDNFSPSENVVITIVSEDPFVVKSKHRGMKWSFQYNFRTGNTVEQRQGD